MHASNGLRKLVTRIGTTQQAEQMFDFLCFVGQSIETLTYFLKLSSNEP